MRKFIIFTLLLTPVVIGIFLYIWFYRIDRIGCGEKGMSMRVGNGLTGYYQYCVTEYSDGGKSCISSDECQGDCVINNERTQANCENDSDSTCGEKGTIIENCPLDNTKDTCVQECYTP